MPQPFPRELTSALLAAIVESSDDAIASKNLDGIVTSWNRSAERLWGYSAAEIIGRPISVLAAPGRESEMPMILERIRRGERVDNYETVRRRKDGSLVEISLTVSPILDDRGRVVGASKIARDITGRRLIEREREIRVGELQHRIKNLLGMIGSIARQTAVADRTAEEYRNVFLGRIAALTTAHEAAFQEQGEVDLAALITRLLEPYAPTSRDRAAMIESGPAVTLAQQQIQPLAFILHELATNSVKHGALSQPEGRLRITWQVEETQAGHQLSLDWQERGGPTVHPPSTRGFGMKLIDFAATAELGGRAELIFATEGLDARITAKLV